MKKNACQYCQYCQFGGEKGRKNQETDKTDKTDRANFKKIASQEAIFFIYICIYQKKAVLLQRI